MWGYVPDRRMSLFYGVHSHTFPGSGEFEPGPWTEEYDSNPDDASGVARSLNGGLTRRRGTI